MIPSSSSPTPTPSISSAVGASSSNSGQQVQELPGASSYAGVQPSLNDGDEFYILCKGYGYNPPGPLRKEVIEKLRQDNPGIFDGLDSPDDLFRANPIKYQPLAKLILDTPNLESILDVKLGDLGNFGWYTDTITYEIYKHNFYEVLTDIGGKEWVLVDDDSYDAFRKRKQFVSQLREILFDESMSSDHKINELKGLFPPIDPSGEDVSLEQLVENMDFLYGDTFKKAQQRAIEAGCKP